MHENHYDQGYNPNPKKVNFSDIPADIIAPEIRTEVDKIVSDNGSNRTMEIGNAVKLRIMQAETNALKGESVNAQMSFELLNFNVSDQLTPSAQSEEVVR
jgi:hypothetical protein